jgi:YebC/PmpR family DNA-binding regulatory protein
MSGHSKWSTIKRQKGAKDQKRGQIFTKLSYAIATAVREGGGVSDPASNFRLRLAIEDAKNANMPKENIKRAIDRASGKQEGNIEEIIYEGYGPSGVSLIVETLTDNKQRTISEVKNAFEKNGGSFGVSGSVLFQFERVGMIVVEKKSTSDSGKMNSLEDIFLLAADFDVEDVEEDEDDVIIYTKQDKLASTRDGLVKAGLSISEAKLIWRPINNIVVSDPQEVEKVVKFINNLEELDDVQRVYANLELGN